MKRKNKEERLRELTWKYFKQQKLIEGMIGVVGIILLIFVPYYLGIVFNPLYQRMFPSEDTITSLIGIWAMGFALILWVTLTLLLVGFLLYWWLTSNWERAEERAEEELEKR